ncbi:MAG: hypothetical protein HN909_01630 [Phycisphaerales bacterium]|jgi:hypothetical protein|nr:hypothetical protein [Phycisphaerales bacterium]MBT7170449.1 hypothetical protein [Phycisphaerales bacterium]
MTHRRILRNLTVLALLIAGPILLAAPKPANAPATTPPAKVARTGSNKFPLAPITGPYTVKQIEGFTIVIHNDLLTTHKELGTKAINLLTTKLSAISRVVPPATLVKLKTIRIWFERDNLKSKGACYHPNPGWIKANKRHPGKAHSIEFAHAKNFLAWSRAQPWMVLHELAHAYHHQFLGFNNPIIIKAYKAAKAAEKYTSVLHVSGKKKSAYARTNHKEYFAELTEAWFGRNDFYPFVQTDVKKYDPAMAKLLPTLWGVQPRPAGKPAKRPTIKPSQDNTK